MTDRRSRLSRRSLLAAATDDEELLELSQRLVDLQDALDHHEARFGRHRAEEILLGLGFRTADLERRCDTLSAWEKSRSAIASARSTSRAISSSRRGTSPGWPPGASTSAIAASSFERLSASLPPAPA